MSPLKHLSIFILKKFSQFLQRQSLVLFLPFSLLVGVCFYYFCSKCSVDYQGKTLEILLFSSLLLAVLALSIAILNKKKNCHVNNNLAIINHLKLHLLLAIFFIVLSFVYTLIFNRYLVKRNIIINEYLYGNIIAKVVDINQAKAFGSKKESIFILTVDGATFYREPDNHSNNNLKFSTIKNHRLNAKIKRNSDKLEVSRAYYNKKLGNEIKKCTEQYLKFSNELQLCKNKAQEKVEISIKVSELNKQIINLELEITKLDLATTIDNIDSNNIANTSLSAKKNQLILDIKERKDKIFKLQWAIKIPAKYQKIIIRCKAKEEINTNCEDDAFNRYLLEKKQVKTKGKSNKQAKESGNSLQNEDSDLNKNNKEDQQSSEFHEESLRLIGNSNLAERSGNSEEANNPDNSKTSDEEVKNIISDIINRYQKDKTNAIFAKNIARCLKYQLSTEVRECRKNIVINFKNWRNSKNKKIKERLVQNTIKKELRIKEKNKISMLKMMNYHEIGNNLDLWQDYDRKFATNERDYFKLNFNNNLSVNGPKKIKLTYKISKSNETMPKIGDIITAKVEISPVSGKRFFGDFNFRLDSMAKGIDAKGKIIDNIHINNNITSDKNNLSYQIVNDSFNSKLLQFDLFIKNLREKILIEISDVANQYQNISNLTNNKELVNIVGAFLIGMQNLINQDTMAKIQKSGLAHLVSISGLHLTLAGLIFFYIVLTLCSLSQKLMLNVNIRKIAAFFAIFSAFFYLQLAGNPLPAVRAFLTSGLLMLVIILDREVVAIRIVALAMVLLTLYNPANIFTISFQLSFVAIASIISFNNLFFSFIENSKFYNNSKFTESNFIKIIIKTLKAFIAIAISSVVATLSTAPFTIYHFGVINPLGIISNFLAIPLVSFVTMPLIFISLIFIILKLAILETINISFIITAINFLLKYLLYWSFLSVDWLMFIVNKVSNMPFNTIKFYHINRYIWLLSIIFLYFAIVITGRVRVLFLLGFCFLMSLIFYNRLDSFVAFSHNRQFFAYYLLKNQSMLSNEKYLIFSDLPKSQKMQDLWLKDFSLADNDNFNIINLGLKSGVHRISNDLNGGLLNNSVVNLKLIECYQTYCVLKMKNSESRFILPYFNKKPLENHIMVIMKRSNEKEICNKLNKDKLITMVVNLTGKYAMPGCVSEIKQIRKIIDNNDFNNREFYYIAGID
jgi:ComEC/Rec2-related protein